MINHTNIVHILLILLVVATLACVLIPVTQYTVTQTPTIDGHTINTLTPTITSLSLSGSCTASTTCIVGS